MLGKGYTLEAAINEVNQTVEGINSVKAALGLARKNNVNMPIVEELNRVLFEGKDAREALFDLLKRDKSIEYTSLEWGN